MHEGSGYPLQRIDLVELKNQPFDTLRFQIAKLNLKCRRKENDDIGNDDGAGRDRKVIDRRISAIGKKDQTLEPAIFGFNDISNQ